MGFELGEAVATARPDYWPRKAESVFHSKLHETVGG